MHSIIQIKTHPFALETMQARRDYAEITGQPIVERPYWYENTETGELYYDIYGCIAWPMEVSDKEKERPGYAAIIGVVRPSDSLERIPAADATFKMLAEYESGDIEDILNNCLGMRNKFGFKQRPGLLQEFIGDPERFLSSTALFNERLVMASGLDSDGLLITPPDDFNAPQIFDHYARSLKSCIVHRRLHPGNCNLFVNRLKAFQQKDPIVMAIGGIIHTLMARCLWMDTVGETMFRLRED